MAIRIIREVGDDILRAKAKPVAEMTPRLRQTIEDMFETMYENAGVGLAAPQVGIRRRMFVVDCGLEQPEPHVMINPEILETSGEQTGNEGCLSVPGKHAEVTRPSHVKVKAYDIDMNEYVLEADGLLARAILHENDHLDGILYIDKMNGELQDNEPEEEDGEE